MKTKMGRPRIEIDYQSAEKLASLHCTGEEIAAFLGVDYKTLERAIRRDLKLTFGEWYKRHSAKGKVSLRRKQFEVAMSGNATMLVWMGKQVLEQSDKTEEKIDSSAEILKKIIEKLPGA